MGDSSDKGRGVVSLVSKLLFVAIRVPPPTLYFLSVQKIFKPFGRSSKLLIESFNQVSTRQIMSRSYPYAMSFSRAVLYSKEAPSAMAALRFLTF